MGGHLDDLPQRSPTLLKETDSRLAFSQRIKHCFEVRDEVQRDYGVDVNIEAVEGTSATNLRAQAQLKAYDLDPNRDGSLSCSVERTNLNYLLGSPNSFYVLFDSSTQKLYYHWADEVLAAYEREGTDWRTQKTITVRFTDELDDTAVLLIHRRVLDSGRAERDRRIATLMASAAPIADDGAASGTSEIDAELDRAKEAIGRREHRFAELTLDAIKLRYGAEMSAPQRYRLGVNGAGALMGQNRFREAGVRLLDLEGVLPDSLEARTYVAFGHELAGDRIKAHAQAAELVQLPGAPVRAFGIFVRTAPPTIALSEIEQLMSSHSTDAEVAAAVGIRAIAVKDYEKAFEWTSRAVVNSPDWCMGWILRGKIAISRIEGANSDVRVVGEAESAGLQSALTDLTKGIELAEVDKRPRQIADALLARAQIRDWLGDVEGATDDEAKAVAIDGRHPAALVAQAGRHQQAGDLTAAIQTLRIAVAEGGYPRADMFLAGLLQQREDATNADLEEAISICKSIANDEDDAICEDATDIGVRVLLRIQSADRAAALVECARLSPPARAVFQAALEREHIDKAKASELLKTAFEGRASIHSKYAKRRLAVLLQQYDDHTSALEVWKHIAPRNEFTYETSLYLQSAFTLGRHDVVLEVCRDLRRNGVYDTGALRRELSLLERYEPDRAVAVLQEHLAHRSDPFACLRLAVLGLRLGRQELVPADAKVFPDAQQASPADGLIVVGTLLLMGKPVEALRYAYLLVRRNFDDADAHRALFQATMLSGNTIAPMLSPQPRVVPGTAVLIRERGTLNERWYVIEDEYEPDAALSEIGADTGIAKALDGAGLGDAVTLAKGAVADRVATVVEILPKFGFRARDTVDQWQVRFRDSHAVEVVNFENKADGELDLSPLLQFAEKRQGSIKQVEQGYGDLLLSVSGFGEALGVDTLSAMSHLAARSSIRIKCCRGDREERAQTLAKLKAATAVVIDMTAVATVLMLGIEDVLGTLPCPVIAGFGTITELRQALQEKFGLTRVISPIDGDAAALKRRIERVVDLLSPRATSCPELANLNAKERDDLLNVFDQSGSEAIILARRPGHVLWSDDLAAALGAHHYDAARTWTQAILLWASENGLSSERYADATLQLLVMGYAFTSLNGDVVQRAGRKCEWNSFDSPLSDVVEQLGDDSDLAGAISLAWHLVLSAFREAPLVRTREALLIRILERLSRRRDGRQALAGLIKALKGAFGLNVIGEQSANQTIAAWLKEWRRRVVG